MDDKSIKVGFCVAYDWYLLKHSLPIIYPYADVICLSIDKDRISWAGNKYPINDKEFYAFVNDIDTQHKIVIYEDDFYQENLTSMQNEVRQRKLIAERLGKGGWHIQIDTDEYFLNFKKFSDFLRAKQFKYNINIVCPWITLYKKNEHGYFVVKTDSFENIDFIQIATNNPTYEYGRRNGYFNYYTNFFILHQSWARDESEIKTKIENWGHNNDFDTNAYLEKWRSLSVDNYKKYIDFHPFNPESWQGLDYVKADSISELINSYKTKSIPISPIKLKLKNSVNYSRLAKVFPFLGIK